jgi:hypothetical protein
LASGGGAGHDVCIVFHAGRLVMPSTASIPDRRYDLDWIRVGAFFLLILYHVGMFYVPWEWHVKSPHPVEALEPVMLLTNPWRLTLLFLVSGAATRFMADKTTVGKADRRPDRAPAAAAAVRDVRDRAAAVVLPEWSSTSAPIRAHR